MRRSDRSQGWQKDRNDPPRLTAVPSATTHDAAAPATRRRVEIIPLGDPPAPFAQPPLALPRIGLESGVVDLRPEPLAAPPSVVAAPSVVAPPTDAALDRRRVRHPAPVQPGKAELERLRCPTCRIPARIDIVDLASGRVHMSCIRCFAMWQDRVRVNHAEDPSSQMRG